MKTHCLAPNDVNLKKIANRKSVGFSKKFMKSINNETKLDDDKIKNKNERLQISQLFYLKVNKTIRYNFKLQNWSTNESKRSHWNPS